MCDQKAADRRVYSEQAKLTEHLGAFKAEFNRMELSLRSVIDIQFINLETGMTKRIEDTER